MGRALEKLEIDGDQAFGASLAAHELLENAVKYGQGAVRMLIVLKPGTREISRVEVVNKAKAAEIARLKHRLGALESAPDPMTHYTGLMHEAAKHSEASGLGLARIVAEASMKLSCSVKAGRVAVTAEPGA